MDEHSPLLPKTHGACVYMCVNVRVPPEYVTRVCLYNHTHTRMHTHTGALQNSETGTAALSASRRGSLEAGGLKNRARSTSSSVCYTSEVYTHGSGQAGTPDRGHAHAHAGERDPFT
jgi:hypothetical protein